MSIADGLGSIWAALPPFTAVNFILGIVGLVSDHQQINFAIKLAYKIHRTSYTGSGRSFTISFSAPFVTFLDLSYGHSHDYHGITGI